jgi:SHS2 domain-containing protein
MRQFIFLENVAVADAAFDATGDSPSELFVAAGEAVIETMVDRQTVSPALQRDITLEDEELGSLLFDWLSQIVFLKDAEGLMFRDAEATVEQASDGKWHLCGRLAGEALDPDRHELRADVKAVTKHLYEVGQTNGRWHARVVLDI